MASTKKIVIEASQPDGYDFWEVRKCGPEHLYTVEDVMNYFFDDRNGVLRITIEKVEEIESRE